MDPNDNREYPTYSGEIFFTVTTQVDDIEASDKDDLISEFKKVIANKLEGLIMPASVVYEDDDLSVSNEPEDFMSRADRLHEQKYDK
jgi:hypothetical protein